MGIRWPSGQGTTLLTMAMAAALIAAGCGGGKAQPEGQDTPAAPTNTAAKSASREGPKSARAVPLTPSEKVAARRMGQRACRGLDPLEAARRFSHAARRA